MPDENSICFDAVAVSAFGETFSPNIEPSRGAKPRPPIMVPAGCEKLLSSGCAVSSSDTQVDSEALAVITEVEVYGDPCAGKGKAHIPPSAEKTPIRVRLPKPQR